MFRKKRELEQVNMTNEDKEMIMLHEDKTVEDKVALPGELSINKWI